MDSSRLPSSTYSSSGAPHDAGSSSTKTTHSSSMWPPVMTGVPNVFPQRFAVVAQNPQATYSAQLSASNTLQHVPNQQFQPQTSYFNQTVRANGDSSVQTRFMYISGNFVRHQNNLTFVEGNRTVAPFVHRGSTPVIEGLRPIVTTTFSNRSSQPISVRWNYSGREVRNVSLPTLVTVNQETPATLTQRPTYSDSPIRGPGSPNHGMDRESRSTMPQIPSNRVYPSNDPRLSDGSVRIPPILKSGRPQRDPRSGTIVRRILARFSGSHGSVPPVDPRSKASTSTTPASASRSHVTQSKSVASVAASRGSSSGPKKRSQEIVPDASATSSAAPSRPSPQDPTNSALQSKEAIAKKKRSSETPAAQEKCDQLSAGERAEVQTSKPNKTLEPRIEEVKRIDPETTVDRDAGQMRNLSVEQPPDDEETESSESPPPEDPRQRRSSRVCDSHSLQAASIDNHLSVIFDDAEDPRLRKSRGDMNAEGKRHKSVYTSVPKGMSSPERKRDLDRTKSVVEQIYSEITASVTFESRQDLKGKKVDRSMNTVKNKVSKSPKELDVSDVYSESSSPKKVDQLMNTVQNGVIKPSKKLAVNDAYCESSSSETMSAFDDEAPSKPIDTVRPSVTPSDSAAGAKPAGIEVKTIAREEKKPRRKRRGPDRQLAEDSTGLDLLEKRTRNSLLSCRAAAVMNSDSESRESGIEFGKVRKRRMRRSRSALNDDSKEHPNPSKKMRSDVSHTPNAAAVSTDAAAVRTEAATVRTEEAAVPTTAPKSEPSSPNLGVDQCISDRTHGSDPLPDPPVEPSDDPKKNSIATFNAPESSPSVTVVAQPRSEEEERLREEHERENARLVYEKTCEFNRAFENAFPLRFRDDQMDIIVKTLTEIMKGCPASKDPTPTKPGTVVEPTKKSDPVEVHLEKTTDVPEKVETNSQPHAINSTPEPPIDENDGAASEKEESVGLRETLDKLLKPLDHLELWSSYNTEEFTTAIPVIVLRDIQLGTSTTRRLRLSVDEIRRRELFCNKCSFVSLNNLSLERHIESFHPRD